MDFELYDAIKKYVDWHGGCHEEDCPLDDTCNCKGKPINDAINCALRNFEIKAELAKQEEKAASLCYCCHHKRGECPHCPDWKSGLEKLMDATRGNAQPSSVCQCNNRPVRSVLPGRL